MVAGTGAVHYGRIGFIPFRPMRPTLTALLILFCAAPLHAEDAWPGVEFKEVRAYAWPQNIAFDRKSNPNGFLILRGGRLAPGALNPEGAVLTPDQVNRLRVAEARRQREINTREGYIRVSMCGYSPHNAFVFCDAQGRAVAFLEICFDCIASREEPEDAESEPDYYELGRLCAELKLPFGDNASLAKLQRRFRAKLGAPFLPWLPRSDRP